MERVYPVLAFLFVGCLLLPFHSGCQHRKVSRGEQAKLTKVSDSTASLAPDKTADTPKTKKASPKIVFEKVVYDFGQVGPTTRHNGRFRFTNTGEGLLKIAEVETCCGVVVKLEKKEYTPGESGVLEVAFSSTNSTGPTRRIIYVNSNDKKAPKIALAIKADVIQKVVCEPKSLKLLLSEQNAGCKEITLHSVDNQPFSITGFKSTLECITADVDPSVQASKFILQPKVDMEKLQNTLRGNIYISVNHPNCDGFAIGFDVLPRFEIKPPLLIEFYVEPQKPITRYVWILNNYKEDFEIESASSKEGLVKLVRQKKIRKSYQLELEITPPAIEGKGKFTDQFFIKIKGGEELRIVCQGIYSGNSLTTK